MGPEEKAFLKWEFTKLGMVDVGFFVVINVAYLFFGLPPAVSFLQSMAFSGVVCVLIGFIGSVFILDTFPHLPIPRVSKYNEAWEKKHPKFVPPPAPTMASFMDDVEKRFRDFLGGDKNVRNWSVHVPRNLNTDECVRDICRKYPSFKCLSDLDSHTIEIVPK